MSAGAHGMEKCLGTRLGQEGEAEGATRVQHVLKPIIAKMLFCSPGQPMIII